MKQLVLFEDYKQINISDYDELMGKLLHVYGGIPVSKRKASVVIKKIIIAQGRGFYELESNKDINLVKDLKKHDEVRFLDYFDSLLKDKDIRGHNFEGFICGVFNGELSERGAPYDLTIGNKRVGVKFRNYGGDISLGTFKSKFKQDDIDIINEMGGIHKIIKGGDLPIKEKVFDAILEDADVWIVSTPDKEGKNILMSVITNEKMRELLELGVVVAGKKGNFSISLSTKISNMDVLNRRIIIPELKIEDLLKIYNLEYGREWAKEVFGDYSHKMRPDVLNYIYTHSEFISKKLMDIK